MSVREPQPRGPEEDDRRLTASLAGLAIALLLLVAGLFLAHKLSDMAKLQDCFMSGRTNCVPIDVPAR
jgi:hypothetical protein